MKFRIILAFVFALVAIDLFAQSKDQIVAEIRAYQQELNAEYRDSTQSPLGAEAVHFTEHEFFPVNLDFRVKAKVRKAKKAEVFKMKTSSERTPDYIKYADLEFKINNKSYKLEVYQSVALIKKEGYRDHLFLPFTDNTNGDQTYGGGRYIDLKKSKGRSIILDFNKAYNPYCAYTTGYSCPVPPPQNHLDLNVEAGIKKPAESH